MTDDTLRAALDEQGVTLDDIDARLASGYAGFKQPLMVAVADVSALRAALPASATDEGPREEFNERWCPNRCGTVLSPSQDHYDGQDGYVCRPAVPEALMPEPECLCEGEFPIHCGPECECWHHARPAVPDTLDATDEGPRCPACGGRGRVCNDIWHHIVPDIRAALDEQDDRAAISPVILAARPAGPEALDRMSLDDLRHLAEARGITYWDDDWKRADFIAALPSKEPTDDRH